MNNVDNFHPSISPQVTAAIKRALIAAVLSAAPILIATVKSETYDPAYSAYIFFIVRIAEGLLDGLRNKNGDLNPGDVGAYELQS